MTAKAPPAADDLEALFDSIAAERDRAAVMPDAAKPAAPAAIVAPPAVDDLEALFDSVAAARVDPVTEAPPRVPAAADSEAPAEHLFHRIGRLTRTLHDALRELGYDKKLAAAASGLPDARDRLAYIATLTGQAAERVLSAVEAGQKLQQDLEAGGRALAARWSRLYANELSVAEFKQLAGETRDFLDRLPAEAGATKQQLHEIMMAQDFHDLTGQVIKKVVELAGTLEASLVSLLVETQQVERKADTGWLNGPVIGDGNPDVVKNQAQVDVLLESLGF
jgi:chemotaxis protein CheZ